MYYVEYINDNFYIMGSNLNQSQVAFKVVSIIVTFNPKDLKFLELNIKRASEETDKVIIVDNSSDNIDAIVSLCKKYQCDLIRMRFNSGVPYALKKGVKYAVETYSPDWILFLDQDSFLFHGAVRKALSFYNLISEKIKNKIGILALNYRDFPDSYIALEVIYNTFAGTLIRTNVVNVITFRVNFFLDQADFDLYQEVRRKGFLTLLLCEKLMHHKIGTPMIIPIIYNLKTISFKLIKKIGITSMGFELLPSKVSSIIPFESTIRFYYIVRNSLILLMERKKDFITFFRDIILMGATSAVINGTILTVKAFGLGVIHGILRRDGVLDASYLCYKQKL